MNTKMQTLTKIASIGFAGYTVVKTVREARADDDGLQLTEALLRGATLALSLVLLLRELRRLQQQQPEVVA